MTCDQFAAALGGKRIPRVPRMMTAISDWSLSQVQEKANALGEITLNKNWIRVQFALEDGIGIVVGEVGDLLPGHPDYGEHLERLHRNPIYVGIRLSNLWGRNVEELLKKPQVWTDLKALSDAGLSLDFGGGAREVQQLLMITDRIPGIRIVINHLPGARVPDDPAVRATWQQQTRELAKRPNIYVKFSEIYQRVDERDQRVQSGGRIPRDLAFYKPRLDEIWDTFGSDRLMFASDWTNSEPMSTFGELLDLVHGYVSQKEPAAVEKLFWKNSLKAYRWKKRAANQPSLA